MNKLFGILFAKVQKVLHALAPKFWLCYKNQVCCHLSICQQRQQSNSLTALTQCLSASIFMNF